MKKLLFLLFFSPSMCFSYGTFTNPPNPQQVQQDFNDVFDQINQIGMWNNYTPTFTGFSSPPTVTARYTLIGKTCVYAGTATSPGTSNATTFTISLPIQAANHVTHYWGVGNGQDNGASQATPYEIQISPNGTVLTLFKDWTDGAWTASGNKYANWTITYETK